ncbi:cell cycle control protein 50A-like [Coregonus clupeaformis]|uniref:cell cycle control protein 50A-like n=1 Tax=Coregonus clupeaformis TaxID=59861 RepID=UPI001E1C7559|nr:cell cycle control protein 50A-like [Coregonus clupeaformis]
MIPELSVMGKAKAHAGLLARRPDNSAFKHQRLPVWSPMLTAHTVLPFFYFSLTLTYHSEKGGPVVHVPLFRKDITWYTDKNVKLHNPPVENKTLTLAQVFEGTAQPLYWQKAMCDLDPWYHNNNGFINEDLIVWMREAAFPNFKKLYEGCRLGTTASISPTVSFIIHLFIHALFYQIYHFEI